MARKTTTLQDINPNIKNIGGEDEILAGSTGITNINDEPKAESTTQDQPILKRANRVTVSLWKVNCFRATFYKTHEEVGHMDEDTSTFKRDPEQNVTLQREMFRQFSMAHAADVGVVWDPTNRQQDAPPKKYIGNDMVEDRAQVVIKNILADITTKMNTIAAFSGYKFDISEQTPVFTNDPQDYDVETYGDSLAIKTAQYMMIAEIMETTTHQFPELMIPVRIVSGQMKNPGSFLVNGQEVSLTATNLISALLTSGAFPRLVRTSANKKGTQPEGIGMPDQSVE